jgi:predicted dehydrogenase
MKGCKDSLVPARTGEIMLKIAIVGCGAIADAHAWAIQQIDGCKMVAACDAEELMAKLFCERFGVPQSFTDLGTMLRETKPDVVHVLTPPQSHYAVARQCLEHGCHLFIEKPLAPQMEQIEDLIQLAAAKKLKMTIGHDAQFSPVTRELRRLVQSGYLGGPAVHMEGYYGYDFGYIYGNAVLNDKRHWVRNLPGKLLQNVISHGVARIAEFIPGQRPQVRAYGFVSPALKRMGECEIVDELRVTVSDETGATAYFTFSSQIRPVLNQFRIYGPKNGLVLDENQQTVIRIPGRKMKSYAEIFVPPAIFAKEYLRNLVRNLRLFLAHDLNMEEGKRFLTESFYRSITEAAPEPIPTRQIWLTSWLMDQIFKQISVSPPVMKTTSASSPFVDAPLATGTAQFTNS